MTKPDSDKNEYLGIDMGSSSVKIIRISNDRVLQLEREKYKEISPVGWWNALLIALRKMGSLENIEAIALSSQVGTYIIDTADGRQEVLLWSDAAGTEELETVRRKYSKEQFIDNIRMDHPDLVSYPIPRLLYIRKKYPKAVAVCQLKDYICEKLTGERVTDEWSWRGLSDTETDSYNDFFVKEINPPLLPPMRPIQDKNGVPTICGIIKPEVALETGLPIGTKLFCGMNDFFCGLLGMGIFHGGDCFDITGTSEHFGCISDTPVSDSKLIAGPYLNGYVHYGVTASSGTSIDFGRRVFEQTEFDDCCQLSDSTPIFLPYIGGERAPIFDPDAMGVFFGIKPGTTKADMSRSVYDGVAFSIYHIFKTMEMTSEPKYIVTGGGASVNRGLNQLKADLFGCRLRSLKEKETSALGAAMIAWCGCNGSKVDGAIERFCVTEDEYIPTMDKNYRSKLLYRFSIYKKLYPVLRPVFHEKENI